MGLCARDWFIYDLYRSCVELPLASESDGGEHSHIPLGPRPGSNVTLAPVSVRLLWQHTIPRQAISEASPNETAVPREIVSVSALSLRRPWFAEASDDGTDRHGPIPALPSVHAKNR